jgi:hypothetical protein
MTFRPRACSQAGHKDRSESRRTATQSVVERKTAIPILSNFLIEAEGDRLNITATDLDQRFAPCRFAKFCLF